jgi:hypothetical protein
MAKGSAGMRRGGNAGGGINSRVNKSVSVRTGAPARGISPGATSQFGSSVGNHATDRAKSTGYRGERYLEGKTPAGGAVRLGNEVAASTVCGVGGSRTVMRSGGQGQHGATNPGQPNPGANKPVFPGFK